MGIDIEMYAETFEDGRWRPSEPLIENEDHGYDDDPLQPKLRPQDLYHNRNRDLFNILRGYSNHAHLAKPYQPIASCRGLPEDVSTAISDYERPRHDDGLFDHSWLTLEELLAFDWHGHITQKTAVVDPNAAHLFDKNPLGFPSQEWPKGKRIYYTLTSDSGVGVCWRESHAHSAGRDFMEDVLSKLKSFGPPEHVRIVFWFNA